MSGDTTRVGGMKMHSLHCPDCSCEVFARADDEYTDGESEYCASCGSLLAISTDAESPLDVRVAESGGDVVARLRAEVEQMPGIIRDRDSAAAGLVVSRAEVERLTADQDASDKLATIVDEAARKMEAHIERLTRELDAAIAGEAKAIADTACARASRDAAKARSRVLLARAGQAERERDDTFEALGFGPAIVESAKGVSAFFGTLHTEEGDDEFLAVLADDEGSIAVEPAEMTVWRRWAKARQLDGEEHEENRRVEALDDAKAAAQLAGPTGGDQ